MKQLILSATLLMTICANATIRTVSNNPGTIAQYNTIQAAVDASASGDSIYVHGSPTTYPSFTITSKQLTIIGPGFAPDKDLGYLANVNGCTITGVASSNTEIQGMKFTSFNVTVNSPNPANLRFIRNFFNSNHVSLNTASVTYSGYLFEGNVFSLSKVSANTASTYQNFLFQNNYFHGEFGGQGSVEGFFNCTNVLFDHNLWVSSSALVMNIFFGSCRFLTLSNNIFVNRNASVQNSNSVFNNNITFNAGDNTPWASNSNIDGGGNVANQDPQMVAQAIANAGTLNTIADYTISTGPANNAGNDGKDMGLLYDLSGSLNWTNSRNSRIPRIFRMNVINPTVAAGGNITITVNARVSN